MGQSSTLVACTLAFNQVGDRLVAPQGLGRDAAYLIRPDGHVCPGGAARLRREAPQLCGPFQAAFRRRESPRRSIVMNGPVQSGGTTHPVSGSRWRRWAGWTLRILITLVFRAAGGKSGRRDDPYRTLAPSDLRSQACCRPSARHVPEAVGSVSVATVQKAVSSSGLAQVRRRG